MQCKGDPVLYRIGTIVFYTGNHEAVSNLSHLTIMLADSASGMNFPLHAEHIRYSHHDCTGVLELRQQEQPKHCHYMSKLSMC